MKKKTEKNRWGALPHPSDHLVHWSERTHDPGFKERVRQLRRAWNVIHSDRRISAAHKILAQWEIDLRLSEEAEAEAWPDL